MSLPPNQLEIVVEVASASPADPLVLKAGENVILRQRQEDASTSYECLTMRQQSFGTVSGKAIERLAGLEFVRGRAKVVRKQPGTETVASVTVRVALNDCEVRPEHLESSTRHATAQPPPSSSTPVIGVPLVQGPSIEALKPVLETPMRDVLMAEEEEGFALTHSQLQVLCCDGELRRLLRDTRLQAVIREIDGAADRERALQLALDGDAAFREFSDRMVGMIEGVVQRKV